MTSRRRWASTQRLGTLVASALALSAALALGGGERATASSSTTAYAPHLDPADFVDTVDNPYFPLTPGARWVYESTGHDPVERNVVTVTGDRRTVMGISAIVVHDTVSVKGEVTEDTYDWYAQDRAGNVWYLGEDTKEFARGRVKSTAWSWEAGVDGAQPGIIMPAVPEIGVPYRQEYLRGEAEDMAKVKRLGARVRVPFGRFEDVLVTREWTPLEPKVLENKYYARGIGNVAERSVHGKGGLALIQFHPGD